MAAGARTNPGWLLIVGRVLVVAACFGSAACSRSDTVPPTATECVQMADRMYPEPADAEKREEKLERCLPTNS